MEIILIKGRRRRRRRTRAASDKQKLGEYVLQSRKRNIESSSSISLAFGGLIRHDDPHKVMRLLGSFFFLPFIDACLLAREGEVPCERVDRSLLLASNRKCVPL